MMGVVEVFPEWPPWFAFTLLSFCIQCAELHDDAPAIITHSRALYREFHLIVASIGCLLQSKKAFTILARAKHTGM
jgi:hypothetical protein